MERWARPKAARTVMACAAAVATVRVMREELVDNARFVAWS
jgi:hypothetical protein